MKSKTPGFTKAFATLTTVSFLVTVGRVLAAPDADWESEFPTSNTFWGAETNGIKAALLIEPIISSNNIPICCTPILKFSIQSSNSLHTVNVYFPPFESCFGVTLRDDNGNDIPKTDKGKSLGKAISGPLMVKIGGLNSHAGFRMVPIIQNHSEVLSEFAFNLQDYFFVTNSGKYHLIYEMHVVLPQFDKGSRAWLYTEPPQTIVLPPVAADIETRLK